MGLLVRGLVFLAFLLPSLARAEDYPPHPDLFVNDMAGLIAPDAAQRIRSELEKLKTETGVEMTVLTINSRHDFNASGSLEAYATALFNNWGIGRAAYNDGILVLVARQDREMRIELGKGFNQGYDVIAQDVINRSFLPSFRADNYSVGIETGVMATIERIARPRAAGLPPPEIPAVRKTWFDQLFPWLFGLVAAGIVTAGVAGRALGDWSYRFRSCPQCGQRGLHRDHILQSGGDPLPPETVPGSGRVIGSVVTRCGHCGYRDERPWRRMPTVRSNSSGGSFGGGRSSGGGASGRW